MHILNFFLFKVYISRYLIGFYCTLYIYERIDKPKFGNFSDNFENIYSYENVNALSVSVARFCLDVNRILLIYCSYDEMEKTRNWARIKINVIACVVTGIVCIFMVYSGKQAAKRGESLQKINIEWHKEQNEKK